MVGLVALTSIVTLGWGCAPRTEIGDSTGGAAGMAGSAGSPAGSGGSTADPGGRGGTAGSAGAPPAPAGCFDVFEPADGESLELGPGNAVFPEPILLKGSLRNYAAQPVFTTPSWQLNANFPTSDAAYDTELDLPAELESVAANVGEVYVARSICDNQTVAGRTVRVHAYWQLDGAIGASPTEGISLGLSDGTWFEDATIAYTRGEPDDQRPLNTLNALVLEHTFDEDVDAEELVLRLWLLDDFNFPSTLYVNRVEWE